MSIDKWKMVFTSAHCSVIVCAFPVRSSPRARMIIRSLLETGERNHAALILADRAITYQQLDEQIDHAAAQLTRLGFRKRDRIGLAFSNGLEMIVSFLAITYQQLDEQIDHAAA